MPLQTEALAVINELPKGDTAQREALIRNYAHQIAGQTRTLYRDDDETATTQAWLFSVGGTNANPSIFTIGAGLTLSVNTSGAVAIVGTTPASTSIAAAATRGSVRRLVAPLGITLTGLG
jgi:hypothetical protein